jgi:SNF2 family DNA or RNA helicase
MGCLLIVANRIDGQPIFMNPDHNLAGQQRPTDIIQRRQQVFDLTNSSSSKSTINPAQSQTVNFNNKYPQISTTSSALLSSSSSLGRGVGVGGPFVQTTTNKTNMEMEARMAELEGEMWRAIPSRRPRGSLSEDVLQSEENLSDINFNNQPEKIRNLQMEDQEVDIRDEQVQKRLESLLETFNVDIPPEERINAPPGMQVELKEYQRIGVAWMLKMERSTNRGGILSDEMGLGKVFFFEFLLRFF